MCRDLEEALEDAKQLDIVSILTSGGCGSALEGASMLNLLKEKSGSVDIMAAAGIDADVIRQLKNSTCLTAFHMSGKKVLQSHMKYRNVKVSMGLPSLSEYEIWQTDAAKVQAARCAMLDQI